MRPDENAPQWPTTTIGKSAYLRGRIGWQGLKASEFLDEGPFLVTGTNFVDGKVDWPSCYHVSEARYKEAEYIHLQNDDVLVTKDGTIGKVAFVQDCPAKALLNSGIFLIRCNDKRFEHRYLFYVLQSERFRAFLNDNLAGSTISHLYQHIFKEFEFHVPAPQEQVQISTILSALDHAIELTEAVLAKRRRMRSGLLTDLLTKGVDEHGTLRAEGAHQFKDSPLGRIPREWTTKTVAELLVDVDPAMRSGPFGSALLKHELVGSGVPLLGIDNVLPENFVSRFSRFVHPEKARKLNRYRVRPGDIMITIMGTVGRCCVVPDGIGTALSSKHVWTISLDQRLYSPFVACLQINYAPWVLRNFARDQQGGIMAAITADTLRSLVLPVPPPDEMVVIDRILRRASTDLAASENALAKLGALKRGLMQDLLTGRRRVTPLLNAEVAEEQVS